MSVIDSKISGSEKLTGIFGYWPSFHDAEVIDFHLWRGDVNSDKQKFVFPVLTVTIHLWELTNEVDAKGYYVLRHHTRSVLRFRDVADFSMDGFNQQNAILGLSIKQQEGLNGPPNLFSVVFDPANGMSAQFNCFRVEVLCDCMQ
jgi:hypothetical protein